MSDGKATRRVFSWANAIIAFGIISGALGIYSGFFYERRPALSVEVLSNSPVLDVREEVDELTISFKGEQLRQTKRVLSVIVVRVSNTGNAPVLPMYYDSEVEWGLSVERSSVVRIGLQNSSSSYLEGKISPLSKLPPAPNRIIFPQIIFESGQSFTLRILAIHDGSSTPSISAFGKIASIPDDIRISNTYLENAQSSVSTAFSGRPTVQAYRIVAYGFAGILCLIAGVFLVFAVSSIPDSFEKRRAEKKIVQLLQIDGARDDEDLKRIIGMYRQGGKGILRNINFYIQDPKRLKKHLAHEKEMAEKRAELVASQDQFLPAEEFLLQHYAKDMGETFDISPEFIAKLDLVMEALKIKGQAGIAPKEVFFGPSIRHIRNEEP